MRKKCYKKCSENSRSQIVFRTDIIRKLTLGAPDQRPAAVSLFSEQQYDRLGRQDKLLSNKG